MLDTSHVTETTSESRYAPARSAVTGGIVAGHVFAWLAALVALDIIAPAADPEAAVPAYAALLSLAFTGALLWMAIGFVRRSVTGLHASMVAGGLMAAAAATCLLEGHTALWVPAQFFAGMGLIWLGRRALSQNSGV